MKGDTNMKNEQYLGKEYRSSSSGFNVIPLLDGILFKKGNYVKFMECQPINTFTSRIKSILDGDLTLVNPETNENVFVFQIVATYM